MLNAIAAATAPVSLAFLGSLPELGRKIPAATAQTILAEDLTSGTIFPWGTTKKPPLWHRDPTAVAHERILELASTEILPLSELSKRVAAAEPKLPGPLVKRVQAALVREARLREVPAAPGSKTKCVINSERPQVYLASAITDLLTSFGLTRPTEKIRALLDESPLATPQVDQDSLIRDAAEKIFSAMNRIAFSPGTTVTFYRLRQQPELADIPKQIFDRAALLLQTERRALLSTHDHAAALPAEQQEGFVTDGLGKFYVSIYAR